MARFFTSSLISIAAIATLALGAAPASACPRDGKGDCAHCQHMKSAKKAHAAKLPETRSAAKAKVAPAKAPAEHGNRPTGTTTDLAPRPHLRLLEPLNAPAKLKLPSRRGSTPRPACSIRRAHRSPGRRIGRCQSWST